MSATVWINGVWALTLWLLIPVVLAALLRLRAPELQRVVTRLVLGGAPLVLIVFAFLGEKGGRPLLSLPDSLTTPSSSPESIESNATIASVPSAEPAAPRESWAPIGSPELHEVESLPENLAGDVALHPVDAVAEAGLDEEFLANEVDRPPVSTAPDPSAEDRHPERAAAIAGASDRAARWSGPIAFVWIVGALLGLLRLLRAHHALRQLKRGWRIVRGFTADHVRQLARRLGHCREFDLCASPGLTQAVASGGRPPAVAVPARWVPEIGSKELDPLVLHEIAHLQSRDPFWRSCGWLVSSVLWPHPLAHWARRREELLQEHVADRRVLAFGASARGYARLLGEVAVGRASLAGLAITPGILGNRSHLEGRIRMILSSKAPRMARRMWASKALVTLGTVFVLALAATRPLVGTCDPPTGPTPGSGEKLELFVDGDRWIIRARQGDDPSALRWTQVLCKSDDAHHAGSLQSVGDSCVVTIGDDTWVVDRRTGELGDPAQGEMLDLLLAEGEPRLPTRAEWLLAVTDENTQDRAHARRLAALESMAVADENQQLGHELAKRQEELTVLETRFVDAQKRLAEAQALHEKGYESDRKVAEISVAVETLASEVASASAALEQARQRVGDLATLRSDLERSLRTVDEGSAPETRWRLLHDRGDHQAARKWMVQQAGQRERQLETDTMKRERSSLDAAQDEYKRVLDELRASEARAQDMAAQRLADRNAEYARLAAQRDEMADARNADRRAMEEAIELLRLVANRGGSLGPEELDAVRQFVERSQVRDRRNSDSRSAPRAGGGRRSSGSQSRAYGGGGGRRSSANGQSPAPGAGARSGRSGVGAPGEVREIREALREMREMRDEMLELRQELREERRLRGERGNRGRRGSNSGGVGGGRTGSLR